MRFRLGPHRLGRLEHAASGVAGNSLGLVRAVDLPEFAAVIRRGSCVLHHSLTVHESAPNLSERARRGLVYVYGARGAAGGCGADEGSGGVCGGVTKQTGESLILLDFRFSGALRGWVGWWHG